MAKGYLEAKFESTPGNETNTPTLSTKEIFFPLVSAGFSLNPSPMDRDDELRNQDEPLPVIPESHAPSWNYESRAYPDLLGFILKNMLGSPTTTTGNGVITDPDGNTVPTGAYKHVFTAPFGPSGVNPQTAQYQVAYKDDSVFYKVKGAAVQTINIDSPNQGGVMVKASGLANYMARISDPSLSPSYESLSIRPFERSGLTLPSWLASTAVHQDFGLQIDQSIESFQSLGTNSKFPDQMEKGDGLITFTGTLPQRHVAAADWDALLNNTAFTAQARWLSDTAITGSYVYKLYVDMPNCQYVSGDNDPLDNKRRHGANFNFKATYGGSSASATVTVINATSSYS